MSLTDIPVSNNIDEYPPSLDDSSDDEEYSSDADSEVTDPELRPYEYVVGRISLERTLRTTFYYHATYYYTRGTFPVIDDESMSKARRLIREFLRTYKYANPSGGNMEEWRCPRFVPQDHLMFIADVYESLNRVWCARMYSVVVEPAGTTLLDSAEFTEIHAPGYVAIEPTVSPYSDYPSILTSPPLLPRYALYQDIYARRYCTIGSVLDGPNVYLRPESAAVLNYLGPKAHGTIVQSHRLLGQERGPQVGLEQPCGCLQHRESRTIYRQVAFPNLDDIVFDFSRSAQEFSPRQRSTKLLNLNEEIERTLQIINIFITWLKYKNPSPNQPASSE